MSAVFKKKLTNPRSALNNVGMPVLYYICFYISYKARELMRPVGELVLQQQNSKIEMKFKRTCNSLTCDFYVAYY
jgi:hypothetical protein